MHRRISEVDEATRYVSSVLSTIDRGSADEFLSYLDEECEFRFGSSPPLHGKDRIRAALLDLFSATDAVEHTWTDVWPAYGHIIIRGVARYVFKGGVEKIVPYCDVWRIGDDGKIDRYEIFCDMNG